MIYNILQNRTIEIKVYWTCDDGCCDWNDSDILALITGQTIDIEIPEYLTNRREILDYDDEIKAIISHATMTELLNEGILEIAS